MGPGNTSRHEAQALDAVISMASSLRLINENLEHLVQLKQEELARRTPSQEIYPPEVIEMLREAFPSLGEKSVQAMEAHQA